MTWSIYHGGYKSRSPIIPEKRGTAGGAERVAWRRYPWNRTTPLARLRARSKSGAIRSFPVLISHPHVDPVMAMCSGRAWRERLIERSGGSRKGLEGADSPQPKFDLLTTNGIWRLIFTTGDVKTQKKIGRQITYVPIKAVQARPFQRVLMELKKKMFPSGCWRFLGTARRPPPWKGGADTRSNAFWRAWARSGRDDSAKPKSRVTQPVAGFSAIPWTEVSSWRAHPKVARTARVYEFRILVSGCVLVRPLPCKTVCSMPCHDEARPGEGGS